MAERERILVTGAGGFIGGRVAEILHCAGLAEVRAGLRRWSGGARIGRFPIEMLLCDVTDPAQVRAAMQGVTAVVHCARADGPVNVEGTRRVLEAAREARVRRVVHLSTIAVYGDLEGDIDETTPMRPSGSEYADSKIQAEQLCGQFIREGLPVVILRPTIVYGPFSDLWTIEFAERLTAGRWMLPEEYCQGICNLVYVDDVVGAVIAALRTESAVGEAFNVNGPDRVTWQQYFEALNDGMGLPPLKPESAMVARTVAAMMQPVRKSAKFVLKRFDAPIRKLYQRSAVIKTLMRKAEATIRQTPTAGEFTLYNRQVHYGLEKARRLLGYTPAFDMTDGVALSVGWLKHHRYVPPAREKR